MVFASEGCRGNHHAIGHGRSNGRISAHTARERIGCAGHVYREEKASNRSLLGLGVYSHNCWRGGTVRLECRRRHWRHQRSFDVVGAADFAVSGRLAHGAAGCGSWPGPVSPEKKQFRLIRRREKRDWFSGLSFGGVRRLITAFELQRKFQKASEGSVRA
jgi:hypothetical protein